MSDRLVTGLTTTLVASITIALAACQSPSKKNALPLRPIPHTNGGLVVPTAPELDVLSTAPASKSAPLRAKPLTSLGQNTGARFAPDGRRLLFLSRQRPSHRQAQIYELEIGRMIERRITFHDGDDSSADYLADGERFLYASTTDELKEEPYLIENLRANFNPPATKPAAKANASVIAQVPSEVYLQTLNARDIERLTTSPGFDGEPTLSPDGSTLIFSSLRDGPSHLYRKNLVTLTTSRALAQPESEDGFARFSPNGKLLAWVRFAQGRNTARLMFAPAELPADKITEVALPAGDTASSASGQTSAPRLDLDPVWHPDNNNIVFASNRAGQGFDLYLINTLGPACLRRLTDAPGDELQPAFSPDGKTLVFTSAQSGSPQIYQMEFSSDFLKAKNCL